MAVVQRKAGPVRTILRAGFKAVTSLFPDEATIRQTKLNGFNLAVWANEHIGRKILTTGSFEPEELILFPVLVRGGGAVIDVGANIGVHTINMASTDRGRITVYAFEPVRRNALLIELNCEINRLRNVTVINAPVSYKSGLSLTPTIPENDSAYAYFSEGNGGQKTVSLDDFAAERKIGRVTLVKIDVEGAEMQVLRGAEKLLSGEDRPASVVVEIVPEYLARFGDTAADVVSFMQARGYAPRIIDGKNLVSLERALIPVSSREDLENRNVVFRRVD